jgi:hypothetical protein
MASRIESEIRKLADNRCEYCHFPESESDFPHVLDHIVARQHGGKTAMANLALCCGQCNRFKGPNIASIDPRTGRLVRLYHPRRDKWQEHFHWRGALLVGKTPVGRATIKALSINLPGRVEARRELLKDGIRL